MKHKRTIIISGLVVFALLLAGGYLWIKTDVPEMDFDYTNTTNSVYADWRLEKDGTAVIYGNGKLPWLEAKYRARLYKAEESGTFYAFLKRRFDDCPIQKVVIGKDVSGTIEEYAPFDCSRLTEITADEENPYFSSENGVLFNKDKTTLIAYPEGKKDRVYTVPENVTSIEACAFRRNKRLSSVALQGGLSVIGADAFEFCSALKEVTLPEGLKTIGKSAFFECGRLKTVFVPTSVENIEDDALGFYITKSWFKDSDFAKVKEFKILCPENAAAAIAYAKENNFDCEIVSP